MAIDGQAPEITQFVERVAKAAFGPEASLSASQAAGLCIACGRPALERCYSEAGRREYYISGQCEPCFDSLYDDEG